MAFVRLVVDKWVAVPAGPMEIFIKNRINLIREIVGTQLFPCLRYRRSTYGKCCNIARLTQFFLI